MWKVGFGLITPAVKPGPNISLQRAGIEQNRKGRPTQIVIATIQRIATFGSIFICLALFYSNICRTKIKETNAAICLQKLKLSRRESGWVEHLV